MATDQSLSTAPSERVHTLSTSTTVGEVMRPALTTVEVEGHLAAAAYLMRHADATALVVTSDDEEHRPIAVLTDTDITSAVADGCDPDKTRIKQLWTGTPVTIAAEATVDTAARTMLARRFRHLPVVEGGRLVGIIDIADVCRALLPQA